VSSSELVHPERYCRFTRVKHAKETARGETGREKVIQGNAIFMATITCRFDRSALPSPRGFYERELGKLSRSTLGWTKANCPFHSSKSKTSLSLNLDTGGFCCFGCDAKGGDVIAFVRLRDRCSFKTACQTLGIWRDSITAAERLEIARREQERLWNQQREAERKKAEREERLAIRDELHTAVRLYRKVNRELHQVGPQAEAHWAALPYLLDDWRLNESSYCDAAKLENPYE
jgi:hypothetical protein